MEAEIQFHVASYCEDLIRSGIPQAQAQQMARNEFGSIGLVKEECRQATGTRLLDEFGQDTVHAARVLRKNPGLALAVMTVFSLGIGSTTTVFSLINAVLLHSQPYPDAQRLVYIWTPNPRFKEVPPEMPPSTPDFYAWQQASQSFSELAFFRQATLSVGNGDAVRRIGGAKVSSNFFQTLGVTPELGRGIGAADDQPGHDRVAVISDALWRSHFAADPNVLGRQLQVDRTICTVIGVMPPAFVYPHETDFPFSDAAIKETHVWTPAAATAQQKTERDFSSAGVVIGRLRPGIAIQRAQSEIGALEARLEPLYPAGFRGWIALVRPFVDTAVGPVRPLCWLLLGAVCIVLCIACSNVANLLAAHNTARTPEMGLRSALGANRSRLARQMMTEALLLACGGGVMAVLLAMAAMRVIARLNPGNIPRLEEAALDTRVLLFALGVSLLTGLVSGFVPAFTASRANIGDLLLQGGNKGLAGGSVRLRSGLIVAQVALAVILLAGAGLLIRSYRKVQAVDAGFVASAVTMKINLDDHYETEQQQVDFFRTAIARINAAPGIRQAGVVTVLPLGHRESMTRLQIKGRPARKDQLVNVCAATAAYFRVMGIRLIAGSLFEDDVPAGRPMPLVASESFAKTYFPGGNAVGQEIRLGGGGTKAPWNTIVGVVADVRHSSLEETPQPTVYGSFWAAPDQRAALVIQGALPPEQLVDSIRRIVHDIDATVAPEDVGTMKQRIEEATGPRRFQTVILGVFAGISLCLALMGIYGLLSYSVRHRTAEIGIRMALGASEGQVRTMVLRQAIRLVAYGLALGIAGALACTRVLTSWLYGVTATDPLTLLLVPASILIVATAASVIPAWRSSRIDPIRALRFQ